MNNTPKASQDIGIKFICWDDNLFDIEYFILSKKLKAIFK